MVIGGPVDGTILPGSEGGMVIGGRLGGAILPGDKGGMVTGGLLGHRSAQTTSRYIDWADAPLRGASDQVARRIEAAMAPVAALPDNVRPLRR